LVGAHALCKLTHRQNIGTSIMMLLAAFVITLLVGDLVAIGIAWTVEQFSKTFGLFVFLGLFLGIIPIAWRIAVRVTEPKDTAAASCNN
jgi:uncharacterized membrane protein